MKKIFKSKMFGLGLRILLAVIFIGASLYKIKSPSEFSHQIFNYKILPGWAINPLAIVLPWLQFFSGVALLTKRGSKGAVVCLGAMMIVFQISVASALLRGLNISCGCFSPNGSPATWLTFGRDSMILLLCVLTAFLLPKGQRDDAFH